MARGSSLNNIIIPIVIIGGVAVIAYLLITRTTGGKEALNTGGRWLKNFTDAIDSTGAAIGGTSHAIQNAPKNIFDRLNDTVDSDIARKRARARTTIGKIQDMIGGTGNAIQEPFRNLFGGGGDDDDDVVVPGQRILNKKAPPRITNNAVSDGSTSLDDLISNAIRGRPFRPYSGTAGRPYD